MASKIKQAIISLRYTSNVIFVIVVIYLVKSVGCSTAQWKQVTTHKAAASLSITPSAVKVGLTSKLLVNCSFENDADFHNLMSIILSKSQSENDQFENNELASVSSVSKEPVVIQSLGANVTGLIDASQGGYLSFTWQNPGQFTRYC